MALGVVRTAKGVSTVVSGATVACVGEHDVLVFVITNPLTAAFGLNEIAGLSAKTAAASGRNLAVLALPCRGFLSAHHATPFPLCTLTPRITGPRPVGVARWARGPVHAEGETPTFLFDG